MGVFGETLCRWFVLAGDTLEYHKKEQSKGKRGKPKGFVRLDKDASVRRTTYHMPYEVEVCGVLTNGSRGTLYAYADSEDELLPFLEVLKTRMAVLGACGCGGCLSFRTG